MFPSDDDVPSVDISRSFFALSTTLISTKSNICRKVLIVIMISVLSEHEVLQTYFPQNTTYLSQMWLSQRRSHEM